MKSAAVHPRLGTLRPPLVANIERDLHGGGREVSIHDTPRNLGLAEVPVLQLLDRDRAGLDIENGDVRDDTGGAGPEVTVSTTSRALERVDLGDALLQIGGQYLKQVNLAAATRTTHPAAVAAVLSGVDDLLVQKPDGGRVGGAVLGHLELEDEGFGTGPAVRGSSAGEPVAWRVCASLGGDDVLCTIQQAEISGSAKCTHHLVGAGEVGTVDVGVGRRGRTGECTVGERLTRATAS